MLTTVSSQISRHVATTLETGSLMIGTSSARYPTAATAIAMLPIQLPNQYT